MKAYQLIATGKMCMFNTNVQFPSRKVFVDMESAERYIHEYTEICTTPKSSNDITYIRWETCEVYIVELELVGE